MFPRPLFLLLELILFFMEDVGVAQWNGNAVAVNKKKTPRYALHAQDLPNVALSSPHTAADLCHFLTSYRKVRGCYVTALVCRGVGWTWGWWNIWNPFLRPPFFYLFFIFLKENKWFGPIDSTDILIAGVVTEKPVLSLFWWRLSVFLDIQCQHYLFVLWSSAWIQRSWAFRRQL